jgi:RimJ/RimL family protein N-acetyltransferase
MHRILDPSSMGGLGLRRCQWTTTVLNIPSQNAAKRLGYTGEGVLRAIKVLQPGKEGFARAALFFAEGMCTDQLSWTG